MWRHERDAVSLMGGLLLVLVAVAVLVDDLTDLRFDEGVTSAVVLVAVGAAGLLASLRRRGGAAVDPPPLDGPPHA